MWQVFPSYDVGMIAETLVISVLRNYKKCKGIFIFPEYSPTGAKQDTSGEKVVVCLSKLSLVCWHNVDQASFLPIEGILPKGPSICHA